MFFASSSRKLHEITPLCIDKLCDKLTWVFNICHTYDNFLPMSEEGPIFDYYAPEGKLLGIVSIPHSGEIITQEFVPYLVSDSSALGRDVDTGVHKLVDIELLQKKGIAVLKANIHRVCVDLNRDRDICVLNWESNSHGETLVIKRPSDEEAKLLSQRYHAPYYEMMYALIHELEKERPIPAFVDLHSMPSAPTQYHLKINPNQARQRPDFCLSDRNGHSCRPEFIQYCQAELARNYSQVTLNDPYIGGNITKHINDKFPKINNIQIEINRALYMNELTRELDDSKSKVLKKHLTAALVKTFESQG